MAEPRQIPNNAGHRESDLLWECGIRFDEKYYFIAESPKLWDVCGTAAGSSMQPQGFFRGERKYEHPHSLEHFRWTYNGKFVALVVSVGEPKEQPLYQLYAPKHDHLSRAASISSNEELALPGPIDPADACFLFPQVEQERPYEIVYQTKSFPEMFRHLRERELRTDRFHSMPSWTTINGEERCAYLALRDRTNHITGALMSTTEGFLLYATEPRELPRPEIGTQTHE